MGKKSLELLSKFCFPFQVLGIIENMSYHICPKCNHKEYIFGENGSKTLAEEMKLEILGESLRYICRIALSLPLRLQQHFFRALTVHPVLTVLTRS